LHPEAIANLSDGLTGQAVAVRGRVRLARLTFSQSINFTARSSLATGLPSEADAKLFCVTSTTSRERRARYVSTDSLSIGRCVAHGCERAFESSKAPARQGRRQRMSEGSKVDCLEGSSVICCRRSVHYILSRGHDHNADQRVGAGLFFVVLSTAAAVFFVLPPPMSYPDARRREEWPPTTVSGGR
jgi:hypothetical protein